MVMPQSRFFFRVGAATWITGGIAHFVLIDILTLHGRTRVSEWIPDGDLLAAMGKTTLSFGVLGSTTAFLATAGFSAWVAFSLTLLGITYVLLVGRTASHCGPSLVWVSSSPRPSLWSLPCVSFFRRRWEGSSLPRCSPCL